ncbi:restriction endonuclease subunit S [Stutzerimonas nitrititolerans]|uniref:restriction endonuclease subunit S n=1 Tax=Stutzerimonas nitrititolerans TaxID=2482751 RepID=UPI002896C27F|nr:restriction endonuclease subunit S [Stutzerimonas nitrititolerans]
MSELPKGWTSTHLGSLSRLVMGQAPSGKDCNMDGVGTVFVKAGEFGKSKPIIREWTTSPLKFAQKGDILICVVGATAGKINLAIDCSIGRSVAAIRPATEIQQKYIYYFLAGQVENLRKGSTGSAQGVISKPDLVGIAIPLAPATEQIRIAQKLDELLAQIDTLKARIDAIPALLKRFRQSVLAAAVSGRLTAEWRALANASAGEEQSVAWQPTPLPLLGELARGKSKHRPRNDKRLFGDKHPFIQTGEIANSAGRIKTAKIFYSDFGLAQSRLFPKDTLCITIAANIADTATLDIEACFPDSVVGFIANREKCCPKFVKYLIDVNKQNLEAFAPATAQKNINLKVLSELAFPMPPLAEQTEIVRRVEQLFIFADQLEAKVASAKSRIDHLTQSILAKAFRGELVPQDPSDEPASVLLERIQAQRAAAPKAKRGRKVSTR